MYRLELRDNEAEILRLRYDGNTFRECAQQMGYRYESQAQELYYTTLQKIRTWKDLNEHNIEILRLAKRRGKSQRWVFRLYAILRRNNATYRWKRMSEEELRALPDIGNGCVEFLLAARS